MTEQLPGTQAPSVEPEPAGGPDAIVGWRRMHPITPALKGWRILAVVVGIVVDPVGEPARGRRPAARQGLARWCSAGSSLIALVGFAYSSLAWRVTRFAVTDEAVHLRTGLLFRQQRQARLDRLQAVDVVQPLLARLVGLSELKIETAGGDGSGVSLAFLREADAEVLRAELLALAAGLRRPTAGGPTPPLRAEPDAQRARRRADAGARADAVRRRPRARGVRAADAAGWSSRPCVPAPCRARAAGGRRLVTAVILSGDFGTIFFLLPALFGGAAFVWNRVNQGANFRAAISPDGIRLRHGLTENRAQTVPPGRVQAIRLSQTPLWRGKDWWRVEINVAGYGQGNESQRDTVLHPVATRGEAMTALWLVLPDLGSRTRWRSSTRRWTAPATTRASRVHRAARAGSTRSAGVGTASASPTARWSPGRAGSGGRSTWCRTSARSRSGSSRGSLQRRLGLASFVLHSTPGPVAPRVEHLAGAVAAELLDEQAARARTARATATPEQWMRAVGVPTPRPDRTALAGPSA